MIRLNVLLVVPEIRIDDKPFDFPFWAGIFASIIDQKACMQMQSNQVKISIWYDNEWSYSSQAIKLLEHIYSRVSILERWERHTPIFGGI